MTSLLVTNDRVLEHVKAEYLLKMINYGSSIDNRKLRISASIEDVRKSLSRLDGLQHAHGLAQDSNDLYLNSSGQYLIQVVTNDMLVQLDIHGVKERIDAISDMIHFEFGDSNVYVRWIYDAQYLESLKVILPNKNLPFDSMYPQLGNESLSAYYDRFINSDANILVLLGPPGTGKTSFLRGLLHHTQKNAILTYHTKLLESDDFFAEWFRSREENIVIMEDADLLLMPRSDGNDMMHRFLNLGDGLLSIKGKKMIFTTNLPSIAAIDEALTRPGRCHDVLHFRTLTREESLRVCSEAGIHSPGEEKSSYSLAELFSDTKTSKPVQKSKFGFC